MRIGPIQTAPGIASLSESDGARLRWRSWRGGRGGPGVGRPKQTGPFEDEGYGPPISGGGSEFRSEKREPHGVSLRSQESCCPKYSEGCPKYSSEWVDKPVLNC